MIETSSYQLVNPATETAFQTIEWTSDAELESTLERMRVAQRDWREVAVSERAKICQEFIDAFRCMKEKVALDITRQMGKDAGGE